MVRVVAKMQKSDMLLVIRHLSFVICHWFTAREKEENLTEA